MNSRDMRTMEIGGAFVIRTFSMGQTHRRAGELLSAEEVNKLPLGNRQSLVDSGYLSPFPQHPNTKRFVFQETDGTYSVVEGHVVNEVKLNLEDAKALAQNGKRGKPITPRKLASSQEQATA